jgi:hypothetical protein
MAKIMILLCAFAHERKLRDLQSKRSSKLTKNADTPAAHRFDGLPVNPYASVIFSFVHAVAAVAPPGTSQGSSKIHEVAGGRGRVGSEQRNAAAGGSIAGGATGSSE